LKDLPRNNKSYAAQYWLKLQELDKIYEHFAGNPNVLVASVVDGKLSSLEETNELLKDWKFKHPIYYDSMGILVNKYQIGKNGYPIELRIGKDGYIKQTYGGLANPKMSNYLKGSIVDIESLLRN
jgi:hypothetical protein